ncbi:MAG: transaldolase/glucose-6-phosphate isomerase [Pseudomonadota bacterium]|jgi:transaldolase/glucose-6-phosphate isomerase
MHTNAARAYHEFGQSIWYDNVQRSLLRNGGFALLVEQGVRGCTSNPTIFDRAIGGSADYDAQLATLVLAGKTSDEIYYDLVCQDIQDTADLLLPVYEGSGFSDGYVSIEVQPKHADNAEQTVAEALELTRKIQRSNLMIKVPATPAGLRAITELTAQGICVNVTLIFSVTQYERVVQAYLAGLSLATINGHDLRRITSVASLFISRLDAVVDAWLNKQIELGRRELGSLLGKVAIANAQSAYSLFQSVFLSTGLSSGFAELRNSGAQPQRLLWASTAAKDPAYRDTLYVDALIAPGTVNTVPPSVLSAFQDHGNPSPSLGRGLPAAQATLAQLTAAGFLLDPACEDLLHAGLHSFSDSFESLMRVIEKRRTGMARQLQS